MLSRNGEVDLEAALAGAQPLAQAGATTIAPRISKLAHRAEDIPEVVEKLGEFRHAHAKTAAPA